MASYGVYLAACGYRYHGPSHTLAFAPKVQPEKFKCAFTTAEGWGTYEQKIEGGAMHLSLSMKYGKLALKRLGFHVPEGWSIGTITSNGRPLVSKHEDGLAWVEMFGASHFRVGQTVHFEVLLSKMAAS
jgi:hypothetical protein